MSYEEILKLRIADFYEQANAQGRTPPIRDIIQQFLTAHHLQISDGERLSELEYQVRAELQKRLLESRLRRDRDS